VVEEAGILKKKTLNNQNIFSTPFPFLLAIVLSFLIRYTLASSNSS
jgi:hypothetical protein